MRRTTYVISGPTPRVGIVFDSPGKRVDRGPQSWEQAEQVEAVARVEAGPDEGDKTPDAAYPPQVWAG